jgi:hypothetical protein
MAPFEPDQRAELAPAEPGVGAPAGEMHRIIRGIAARDDFLDPLLRIIIDPDQAWSRAAEARMIEQGEIMKAKLARGIAEEKLELAQVGAGQRGFRKPVAQPPHARRLAGNASHLRARHLLLVDPALSNSHQISYKHVNIFERARQPRHGRHARALLPRLRSRNEGAALG